MSFERINIDIERKATAERQSRANACIGSNSASLQYTLYQLEKAYAEIDRLATAIHAREATLKDCQTENDRLTAMIDELRGKQAEPAKPQWTPPKSLKDGDYVWDNQTSQLIDADGDEWTRYTFDMLRDWTDPPVAGRWRIADGKAEYLGP